MLTEMDLTDDAGEQVVHLDVDQRRHLDVLAVVRVGDRLAFCNQNKQSKSYFCFATSCSIARMFPSAVDLNRTTEHISYCIYWILSRHAH